MEDRERDKAETARANAKAKGVTGTKSGTGRTGRQKTNVLLRSLLRPENSLAKPKVIILVPDSSKSSGTIRGSDCASTPSSSALGAAGAQDGPHGRSTTRALKERTFKKPAYSGCATDKLEVG